MGHLECTAVKAFAGCFLHVVAGEPSAVHQTGRSNSGPGRWGLSGAAGSGPCWYWCLQTRKCRRIPSSPKQKCSGEERGVSGVVAEQKAAPDPGCQRFRENEYIKQQPLPQTQAQIQLNKLWNGPLTFMYSSQEISCPISCVLIFILHPPHVTTHPWCVFYFIWIKKKHQWSFLLNPCSVLCLSPYFDQYF